jgi:hypothetical protein
MATATPMRYVIRVPPDIAGTDEAMEQLRDGLCNASSSARLAKLDAMLDESGNDADPRVIAFERMVDEVVAGIAPRVAQMLEDATADRLPWTPPEQDR